MALYDFKCEECNTILEDVSLSMANYDEERKSVICCGKEMVRYYDSSNPVGIRTDSSPNR